MIAAWMLHAALVAALTALAALLAQHAARALRRPVRFIWVGALFVAMFFSLGRLLLGPRAVATLPAIPMREAATPGQLPRGGADSPDSATGFTSVRARL